MSCLFYFRFYLIYPLYVPYFCDIPRVELGNVMGIPMTGKSFQYFIGLQVSYHNGPATDRSIVVIYIDFFLSVHFSNMVIDRNDYSLLSLNCCKVYVYLSLMFWPEFHDWVTFCGTSEAERHLC